MRKGSFPYLMGTARRLPAPASVAAAVLALVAAMACGGNPPTITGARSPGASPQSTASAQATSSPSSGQASPGASSAPPPVTGAYGVLVSPVSAAGYTVSVVGVDGKVVASAQTSSPTPVTCANSAAAVVPLPVSTTNSRVYFMDSQGAIHYLGPDGDTGRATTVPIGSARRSAFAVSPDDHRIAVVVDDFTSSGAATRLYVEDLNGGGNHVDLFTESGAYTLWPVGWHGTNNLVLAKVAACTQGGGPFCCGPLELHVVDPATAARRFTIGGPNCVIVGLATPAGAVCEDNPNYSKATVVGWTAAVTRTFAITQPAYAYLSPGGAAVALVDNSGTTIAGTTRSLAGLFACTWIDDTHILGGGDSQHQPRVGDINTGGMVAVAAQGDCAGRLPGGL